MNIKIMSYNLRFAGDVPPNSWAERKGLMAQLLETESPDIIGTQEGLYPQLQELSALILEYEWIGLGREGGSKGEFMAIFYKKDRFKVLEFDHFWLSDTPSTMASSTWGNDCVRMATWIRFLDKETEKEFYLLNTHLDHVSENAKIKGAELIIKKGEVFDQTIPLIITGDFNSGLGSAPYKVFTEHGKYIDAWSTASEKINEEMGSFNNFSDPSGGTDRIDWILYRGNVKIETIKNVNNQYDGKFPSDHFPIVANMKI